MKKLVLTSLCSLFFISSLATAGEILCTSLLNIEKIDTEYSTINLTNKNNMNNYYLQYNTGACDNRCEETLEFDKDNVTLGHNGDDATYSIDGENLFVIYNKRNVRNAKGKKFTKAVFYYNGKNLDFYCK